MTKVYFEAEGGRYLLALDGHATGDTSVCAAVSGIVYALAGYLTNAMRDALAEVYDWEIEGGRVRLHTHGGERVEAAYDMAVIGLMQLAKQYPALVAVEFGPD